jgi:glutamate racemase
MSRQAPIGVFDSGVGGLGVAKAIREQLPGERIVYFGDLAHLPYGDKSAETIERYSLDIADFFLQKHCKCIVVACHTASAAARLALQHALADRVPLITMVEPTVAHLAQHYAGKKVGIIGTKYTIQSQVYTQQPLLRQAGVRIVASATPLLVPVIEEGFVDHPILTAVLREYLTGATFNDIQALVLACTHYAVVRSSIQNILGDQVEIIDNAMFTAQALAEELQRHDLLALEATSTPDEFYVSDYTDFFANLAQLFFQQSVHLSTIKLRGKRVLL